MTGTFQPIAGTLVIGVGHKARHGKSTIAQRWIKTHQAERFELSTYVATVARAQFGMTTRDVEKLIGVGQSYRAIVDDEVWLRCCYFDILDKRPRIAVIPNIRFRNEAALIKQMGGYLVRVSRVNADGTPFVSPDRDPNGPMETDLDWYDGWDYALTNYGVGHLEIDADRTLADIWRRYTNQRDYGDECGCRSCS